MPCLEACRLNTQCPAFPPTLWFSCKLMNLITFVSACCCVQKGLFGTLTSMWEGLYSCYIPLFGLVFEVSHYYGLVYQLTAQNMLSNVLTECWYFVPLHCHWAIKINLGIPLTSANLKQPWFTNCCLSSFQKPRLGFKRQSEYKKRAGAVPRFGPDSRHKMKHFCSTHVCTQRIRTGITMS